MRTLRARLLSLALASLGATGCGWMVDLFEPEEITPSTVTLRGTVAVPDGPTDYVVLSPTKWLAYQWESCPEANNNSAHNQSNGTFLLESTNNCAGAQFVYFYADTPADMSKFADGKLTFKVQANNGGQNLQLLVQDNNSATSNTVNLADWGFNSGTVGVDQAIAVPVTALTNGTSLSLSQMKRLFQLQVGCANSDCFTTVSAIRWTPSAEPAMSPYMLASTRRAPYCDPFPCRRVPHGRVGIVRAGANGWTAEPVNVTTTDAQGNYTLVVPTSSLTGRTFIAVSDLEGTFTLLSTIADGYKEDGEEADVDVDRTTTAVAMLVCPNGMTIPADGSGGTCIGDPVGVAELDQLGTAVGGALDKTTSPDIEVFWSDVVDDPDVLAALNAFLNTHGQSGVSADMLVNIDVTVEIPIVVPPTSSGTNNTGGTNTVGAQCQGAVACDVCSVTACAAAGTGPNDCSAWYETSDGKRFTCASCGDCTAAANQATQYCCPNP